MSAPTLRLLEWAGTLQGVAANAHHRWSARESLVVELRDEEGRVGQGEASPLPGHSIETLAECRAALLGLDGAALVRHLHSSIEDGEDREPAHLSRLPAAAAFALDTAQLDLQSQRRGGSLADCLAPGFLTDQLPPMPLAALLPVDEPEAAAERALASGFTHLKVKLGARFDQELALLGRLRGRYGATLGLRLDVNGGWTIAEAVQRLGRLAPLAPEFVEQPVPPAELVALLRALDRQEAAAVSPSAPLAADESLSLGCFAHELLAEPRIAVFVLKPAMLGGLRRAVALGRAAQLQGRRVVVSHLFDGPIALAACAAAAQALLATAGDGAVTAQGLAAHVGLSAWPAIELPMIQGPWLVPPTPSATGLGLPTWPWSPSTTR